MSNWRQKNYQITICKQNNAQCSFQIFSAIPPHTPSASGARTSAHVAMGSPGHCGEVGRVRVYLSISLSPFREKERSQLPDSHENKINRHVNEMCFGCGFGYIGRKSSETYDSTFLFLFLPPVPLGAKGVIFESMGLCFLS